VCTLQQKLAFRRGNGMPCDYLMDPNFLPQVHACVGDTNHRTASMEKSFVIGHLKRNMNCLNGKRLTITHQSSDSIGPINVYCS
jgi:hypothetical protein